MKIINATWRLDAFAALQWSTEEARYHVFVHPQTGELDREHRVTSAQWPRVLFKNSHARHGEAGHFDTRRLDIMTPANFAMFTEAQEMAGPFTDALARHKQAIFDAEAAAIADYDRRAARIRAAQAAVMRLALAAALSRADTSALLDAAHIIGRLLAARPGDGIAVGDLFDLSEGGGNDAA